MTTAAKPVAAMVRREKSPLAESDNWKLAEAFAKSGFFQDAQDVAKAIAKIQAGAELGFGPMASMTGIYVIQGRVTMSANLVAARIRMCGYDYRVERLDNEACHIAFYRDGEKLGVSTFDTEDAKAAGLLKGVNWQHYPRNMRFSRAMTNGARWFAPDAFSTPVYTPDELGATINGETGEVISVKAEIVDPPRDLKDEAAGWNADIHAEPAPAEPPVEEPAAEGPDPTALARRVAKMGKPDCESRKHFAAAFPDADSKTCTPEEAAQWRDWIEAREEFLRLIARSTPLRGMFYDDKMMAFSKPDNSRFKHEDWDKPLWKGAVDSIRAWVPEALKVNSQRKAAK